LYSKYFGYLIGEPDLVVTFGIRASLILAFGHQTFGQILLPLAMSLQAFGHSKFQTYWNFGSLTKKKTWPLAI
jgi:hypothetical protein